MCDLGDAICIIPWYNFLMFWYLLVFYYYLFINAKPDVHFCHTWFCGKTQHRALGLQSEIINHLSCLIFLPIRNTPTKFREAALGRYGAMCKLDGKGLDWFPVRFLLYFFTFFAKRDLISLRNTPTKFREAALGRYGAMCKLGGKELYWFPVSFLSDFFTFFC